MGTYYRIVCKKHKEVLDLNKVYDMAQYIKEFVHDHELRNLVKGNNLYDDVIIQLNEKLREIIKNSQDKILGEKQATTIQLFMLRHDNCKLSFQPDEPFDEEIRSEDGWKWIDILNNPIKDTKNKKHWDDIYTHLDADELGWYEKTPESSIKLLSRCNINKEDAILDIGTGLSTFIDYLVEQGFKNIIATDISDKALEKLKIRLEGKATLVRWIVDDITNPIYIQDLKDIVVWHDRAVLHFLIDENDQRKYLSLLKKVIKKECYVIIATFSLKGVKKCSGLDVKNYDQNMLANFLGEDFNLIEYFDDIQHTPSGEPRPYIYTLFQRVN